jgi:flagellar secretion chaperone FliS
MSGVSPTMRYLEATLASCTKEELIVKVFDGMVLFSRQAIERMKTAPKDIQGRHDLLMKAQRACSIAMGSIDFEIGGDLARSNFLLYEFWHHELVMANIEGNVARVEAIVPHMQMMREAWTEAVRRYKIEILGAQPRLDATAV